ncbi:hypothetical protein QWA68_004999 [Fusarium oxysporum]|nr:hypothetical protein QWA68_004999 [Fusarium oxysporum]
MVSDLKLDRRSITAQVYSTGGPHTPVGLITTHSQCPLRWGILVSGVSHQVHRIFLFSFRIQGNEPVFCSSSRSATVDYLRPLLQ